MENFIRVYSFHSIIKRVALCMYKVCVVGLVDRGTFQSIKKTLPKKHWNNLFFIQSSTNKQHI